MYHVYFCNLVIRKEETKLCKVPLLCMCEDNDLLISTAAVDSTVNKIRMREHRIRELESRVLTQDSGVAPVPGLDERGDVQW